MSDTTDEERLAAIRREMAGNIDRMSISQGRWLLSLVDRLKADLDEALAEERKAQGNMHESFALFVSAEARAEQLRALVARLEAAARELLTANAESWTGGDATVRAYEAEAKLRAILDEG